MLIKLDSWQLATTFSRLSIELGVLQQAGLTVVVLWAATHFLRIGGVWAMAAASQRRRTAAVVVYAICAYQLSGTRSLLNMNWITRPGIDRALWSEFTNFIQKVLIKGKQKFVNRYFLYKSRL